MSITPELVEQNDGGKLIKKIVALEAILATPGEMVTDEQGREFIPLIPGTSGSSPNLNLHT